jgi:hypothetical protein
MKGVDLFRRLHKVGLLERGLGVDMEDGMRGVESGFDHGVTFFPIVASWRTELTGRERTARRCARRAVRSSLAADAGCNGDEDQPSKGTPDEP